MALEQISTEMDVDIDQKNPGKPKRKLASMKKVEVMDTELRRNVPVSQVKKEDAEFVKAMVTADRMRKDRLAKERITTMKSKSPTMKVKSGTVEPTYKVSKPKLTM